MTREVLASDAHHEAVVYLSQATSTGPPWLAIVLASIALLSAVAVALAPAVIERAKRGKTAEVADKPVLPTPPSAAGAVDLTGEALRDAWSERDEAQRRADRLQKDLTAAHSANADLKVELARKQARVDALESLFGGQFGTGKP